ncbi:hypothetical protein AVEN_85486-1 [Araneus ventricosus]|uniref:Uncharacterized protein n=1 Tax=Araneus ventricosus TaxID=182803 RepID=A0A4Y2HZ67_ARAVE|nr:hypothetical protein AVEN_85486-1 [Araneus ventricosus]
MFKWSKFSNLPLLFDFADRGGLVLRTWVRDRTRTKHPPFGVAWNFEEKRYWFGCRLGHLSILQNYEARSKKGFAWLKNLVANKTKLLLICIQLLSREEIRCPFHIDFASFYRHKNQKTYNRILIFTRRNG